jgi:hypothetical protein
MKYVACLLCLLFLLSCKKPNLQTNEITKVELARSGAWSDFGATISVDSSLAYKYFGDYGKVKQGYFIGRVSRRFWDTLNQKLEEINFKTINSSDNLSVADVNYFEVIVYFKNQKRRIIRVNPREKDAVINAFMWLNDSYKNIKLYQFKNAIKFETTYHELPKPSLKQIKFPPPTKQ